MSKSRNLGELAAGKINTHLVPSADSSFDLGHSDYKLRTLYLSGNTIFLGDSGSISAGPEGIEMPSVKIGTGDTRVVLSAQTGGKLKISEEKDSAGAAEPTTVDFASEAYVLTTVDSAYIQNRQINYLDSSSTVSLIDSAYVYNRAIGAVNAGISSFLFIVSAGATVISGTDANSNELSFTGNNIYVNLNGVMVLPTLDYTIDSPNNTITFLNALSNNDQVHITTFNPASSSNLTNIFDSNYLTSRLSTIYPAEMTKNEYIYTTSAAQTVFTGVDSAGKTLSYDSNTVEVFANGIRLFKPGDYVASNGTSITLDDSIGTGSQVVVVDRSSLFGIATDGPLRLSSVSAPASNTSTGIKGDVVTDASYLYVCTAANTWVRTSIDTSW